jgi:steroid delta-isomerase
MDLDGLLAAYLEAHGRNDLDAVIALFGDGAVLEDPVGSRPHHGRAAIRAFYAETHARNGRLEIERVGPGLQCGDELVAHVRARLMAPGSPPAMDVVYWLRPDPSGRIERMRVWY